MPCLDELNNWLLQDNNDSRTEEELEVAMFPPEPSCLDVHTMPALKPKPALRPTINQRHAELINDCNILFFVAFESE